MLTGIKRPLRSIPGPQLSDRQRRFYNFLKANPIGVLSTVNPDGEPHGVVIYFAVNERFDIFFLTRAETKKYDNLKHHNHLMLTVYEPASQATLQVTGRATEITAKAEISAVAGNIAGIGLRGSEAGLPPIAKLQAGDYAAFKIEPIQMRMAVYARPDPGEYTDLFESLESFELIV